jgi:hypothetical protein
VVLGETGVTSFLNFILNVEFGEKQHNKKAPKKE